MLKKDAIRALAGLPDHRRGVLSMAARALGVTPQAIDNWPEELTRRIEDRVVATLYRRRDPDLSDLLQVSAGQQ